MNMAHSSGARRAGGPARVRQMAGGLAAAASMPVPRPPLASLETVCTVARERSFLAAADVSGVTHGAISRRVAAVENWLGMALFERHARGVRLTPDGQRFVGRIEQAFAIIDSAADQWRSPRTPRLVRMSVVPAFAQLWLFERQPALESEAPALRIELGIELRNVDIAGGEADLSIRYGRGNWRQLETRPFMPERLYPVAHPRLAAQLARMRRGTGDAALLDMPLLHDSDVTGWRTWFDALGIPFKPRAQDRRFEDYNLVLAAAEAGLGVALARTPLADAYLQRSALVRVSRHEVDSLLSYHFVHAKGENRPEVLALMERMVKALR
ncbi:LysR family transcriptional regulator [Burkholderia cenocepacia]|uniref:LysR substrate-binding domain-containing protein n=1 Tax=Burkholderia cenocepacia TaxID=95486 RepID=UPI00073AB59A|nr:LysR substrate-binding domain-containing protein [Burkholderia cenocepacia]ALV61134.1 LysR family transcriptional regulator [Burkholderia cenocepacia]AQQ44915.1 LysR family transcriptional regulator [Burkholderia cenocepacia]MBR8115829.1 LysR family transcriptional regulator [Burkholderia cenocepacia]MBR8263231.1 LysR family transcriptional regulator [Burkholderia cenocepacia]MBR8371249.1 LysR family transcriptional regulator [Burkholderia cenocepacia]